MNELSFQEKAYVIISEKLKDDGEVTFVVSDQCMQPMVYCKRDTVTLVTPQFPLKKYDLIFFKTQDGKFVLSRIITINSNGTYRCRSDNSWVCEENVEDKQIFGVVKSFNRKNKQIDVEKSYGYRVYAHIWKFLHPLKGLYKYVNPKILLGNLKKKILLNSMINKKMRNIKKLSKENEGVDFGGVILAKDLGFDNTIGKDYEPSYDMPKIFSNLIISESDSIIDLGCGKGYAMYLFSQLVFSKIDGVEINHGLTEIAKSNFEKLFPNDPRFNIYESNVLDFDKFNQYNYFYMFNPFPPNVFEKVYDKMVDSLKYNPRKITIIYQYPPLECRQIIEKDSLFKMKFRDEHTAVYETIMELTGNTGHSSPG